MTRYCGCIILAQRIFATVTLLRSPVLRIMPYLLEGPLCYFHKVDSQHSPIPHLDSTSFVLIRIYLAMRNDTVFCPGTSVTS